MKTLIRFIFCAAVAVAFVGCQEDVIEDENRMPTEEPSAGNAGGDLADGYFRATFFPQQGNNMLTRAGDTEVRQPQGDEVRGYSKAIQTLQCFIYQEQTDGSYLLIEEKDVIEYRQNSVNNVLWPLTTEVSFDLQNGNYKAVFVGNAKQDLFPSITNKILTGVDVGTSKFTDASLNMPETANGLFIFEDVDDGKEDRHNMLYLCTVDFNQDNFNGKEQPPYVLMQRVVSQHVYGRDFLDTNNSVKILVDNIVASIVEGNLLKGTLEGLLKNQLLSTLTGTVDNLVKNALKIVTPLRAIIVVAKTLVITIPLANLLEEAVDALEAGLTDAVLALVNGIVDELVKQLLGPILQQLNKELVGPLTEALNSTLKADSESLLGLHYLLNPWQHVNAVDIQYSSLTKSIGFDRNVQAYYTKTDNDPGAIFSAVPVVDGPVSLHATNGEETVRNVYVTTLSGIGQEGQSQHLLSEINVNRAYADENLLGVVGGLLDVVDKNLLNGLLINIHKDLEYEAQSNLQYETRCELINLTLSDYQPDDNGRKVSIKLELDEVLPDNVIKELYAGLFLEDGPLEDALGAVGGLVNGVLGIVGDLLEVGKNLPLVGPLLRALNVTGLIDLVQDITNLVTGDGQNPGIVEQLVQTLSEGLDIYLPALNVNTIEINGSWDKTEVSNGEIINRP